VLQAFTQSLESLLRLVSVTAIFIVLCMMQSRWYLPRLLHAMNEDDPHHWP